MSARANPAAGACHGCGRRGQLHWRWKPDLAATLERLRCYRCGEDTGWMPWGAISG